MSKITRTRISEDMLMNKDQYYSCRFCGDTVKKGLNNTMEHAGVCTWGKEPRTIDVDCEVVAPKQLPAISDETDYLLSTEANRKRIEQGLKEAALIDQGELKGKTFDEFLEELT